eukprot:TRINITY_DN67640_c7_g2_i2.p2 TRINITY_DN67640_c7_g2~~TRINITY_DN67640_c7_g2_i2.p2  ORF type:complete len:506 (-),score=27.93 TRINITY_DN67640_c7_g2_i2:2583-4100(-)
MMKLGVLLVLFAPVCVLGFYKVNPTTNEIVDEHGRNRIFHGVNAVYKIPPYHPVTHQFTAETSLAPEDMQNLRNWGFNVIRLGLMWPGVMPKLQPNGQPMINSTYLSVMKRLVQQLATYNLSVVLDLHQDLYNPHFCGEGAPDFAVQLNGHKSNFPHPVAKSIPRNSRGIPITSDCLKRAFALYYVTYDVGRAFQSLYTNDTIQSYLEMHWATVAQWFKDEPNVLGYELINEPYLGSEWDDPSVLKPGYTEKTYLQPLYDKLFEVISRYDKQHIVFYEPTAIFSEIEVHFSHGPGGRSQTPRQVLSYHLYCPDVKSSGAPRSQEACKLWDEEGVARFVSSSKRLGGGGLMTEWGALDESESSLEEIDRMTGLADQFGHGWIIWTFKSFHDITTANRDGSESFYYTNGTLQAAKVKHLSRTYPHAIAGHLQEFKYDPNTQKSMLRYAHNAAITAPTVVYVNIARGQSVISVSPSTVRHTLDYPFLYVTCPSCTHSEVIRVTISPTP